VTPGSPVAGTGRLQQHRQINQRRSQGHELREVLATDQAIRAATPPARPALSAIAAELEATQ
jgi:hypothetical protein